MDILLLHLLPDVINVLYLRIGWRPFTTDLRGGHLWWPLLRLSRLLLRGRRTVPLLGRWSWWLIRSLVIEQISVFIAVIAIIVLLLPFGRCGIDQTKLWLGTRVRPLHLTMCTAAKYG